jgi:hypothetical protein
LLADDEYVDDLFQAQEANAQISDACRQGRYHLGWNNSGCRRLCSFYLQAEKDRQFY